MKTFNHDTVELPELKTKNIDKKRFYLTPDGNEYPSITTVLSVRNKEALFEWRKRVGNEVANHVSRQAMTRGTKVHHMCEDFLNNEFDINKAKKDFLPYCLFTRLAEEALCKIDMIKSQESIVSQNMMVYYQLLILRHLLKNEVIHGTKTTTFKVQHTLKCLKKEQVYQCNKW